MAEIAVIGVPDASLGEEVHAVVAVKAGHSVTDVELTEFGKQKIARGRSISATPCRGGRAERS